MLKARRHTTSRNLNQLGGGCAVLFGLPFILIGLAVGLYLYLPVMNSWWSARGWEEVPCRIESAELKTSRGSEGDATYQVEASYHYEFDRRSYHGDKVSFSGGSDNIGDFQQQVFKRLRECKDQNLPFRCFVNPSRPEQAVLFRDLRWGLALMMSIFPTVFPLAGFLVSVGGWLQARKARINYRLSVQNPDKPWLWKQEWAGGVVRGSYDGLPFTLGGGCWIMVVQLPLALAVVLGGELAKSTLALLALLPSALALILLRFAWLRIKVRMVFGRPSLRLGSLPVRPGAVMAGELLFERSLSPVSAISVRVMCQRHITRVSGDSNNTAKETIWECTKMLSAAEARREVGGGFALPLRIDIPKGLPCSEQGETSIVMTEGERHVWTMEVGSSNGSKLAMLLLPVFASHNEVQSDEAVAEAPVETVTLSLEDLMSRLKARGIQSGFDQAGLPLFIDCSQARNRSTGLFLLFFGSVWMTAFLVMNANGAPLIFRLFWGITSPLILGGALWSLLHRRRIEFDAGRLNILNSFGPFYSWRENFEPRHITGFVYDTHLQSGSRFYYRVRAETIFGQKKTLADGITESLTAETLVRHLEQWRKRG